MAPTLRNGVVRGHHKQSFPTAQKFCHCKECALFWEVDRGSNRLIVGRYLGITEWNRHRSRELREEKISAHVSLIPLDLTPPTMTFPTVPDLFSISPSGPSNPPTALPPPGISSNSPNSEDGSKSFPVTHSRKTKSGVKTIDFISPKLRRIQSSLRSPQAEEIRTQIAAAPLVFVIPPTASTPTDSLYALDPDATPNLTVIGREDWLEESRRFIENNVNKIPKAKVGLRLLAMTLLKQTNKELSVIREEIRLDWERQREAAVRAGKDGINTSTLCQSL